MNPTDVLLFHKGQQVEALNAESGVWREASVIEVKESDHLIHYIHVGRSKKFNEILPSCRIREQSEQLQTRKRKRRHPPLSEVADGRRLIKKSTLKPAYLVKDDTIDITVNNRTVNAIVVMNDPFNHKIQVTNILANRQELMEVTYDKIKTMAATVTQPKAQQTEKVCFAEN